MELRDFVDSLNLPFKGEYRNKEYFISLDNSNDFSKIFNSISLNNNLHADKDSIATEDESMFVYTDGYFDIRLSASYDDDIYNITREEK